MSIEIERLRLENVGQIREADIRLGDLTVLVGPQATGKSIFLQFLRLAADTGYIHDQLRKHGIDWHGGVPEFLDVYLGGGMRGVWHKKDPPSAVFVNQEEKEEDPSNQEKKPEDLMSRWAAPRHRSREASVFYIPAQRVLSLANGWPRPFQAFAAEDPFSIRDFSETFRLLMEQEFSRAPNLFPKPNRLKSELRDLLSRHVFAGFRLEVDRLGAQKRLVLKDEARDAVVPFMAWSAGQREFVPLLMGLYWLLPPSKTSRRGSLRGVIIEEPEMALHPNAISTVLLIVLELLERGYRVCLSTHSPHILDLVWAMNILKENKAEPTRLLDLFDVKKTQPMKEVAEAALAKETRVYYFSPDGTVHDISELDPGADREDPNKQGMADWGGLTEFSGKVNEVVAQVVSL